MYKKVYKGNKYYYAIHIEDINNLVGDLTAIIGTTRKIVFTHSEFDNYVVLYNYNKPNLIVDATEHHGKYLTIYKVDFKDYNKDNFDILLDMIDNYIFDLYDEEEFEDNFIDEIDMREIVGDAPSKSLITLDTFKDIITFAERKEKQELKLCELLEEMSGNEYSCDALIYSKYEDKIFELLCKAMLLDKGKCDDLFWWMYEMNYGKNCKPNSLTDGEKDIDLTSVEKLYNYLMEVK